jgi:hypothetical protein
LEPRLREVDPQIFLHVFALYESRKTHG